MLARSEASANRYLTAAPHGVQVSVNTPEIRRRVLASAGP